MSKIPKEDAIRDALCRQLDIIEDGLHLLSKEAYLPSTSTRSFVDILAVDLSGKYVLIELKRSDAAAREALHEINKYVEASKSYLGVKESELRILIISTEWKELITPFSRFYSETSLDIEGYNLEVTPNLSDLSASKIRALPFTRGRCIAPWHEMNVYYSEASMQRGLSEYPEHCRTKGITDFVLYILRPPANQAFGSDQATNRFEENNSENELLREPRGILYFAMRQLSEIECLEVLQGKVDQEELAVYSEEDESEERVAYFHDLIYSLEPRPHYDEYQIGYPAKLKSFLSDKGGWIPEQMLRYGCFARNNLLTDETIYSEMIGSDGNTGQSFRNRIELADRSQVIAAKEGIEKCLTDNPRWDAHIRRILEECLTEFPGAELDIRIYNPSSALISIYLIFTKDDGLLYMPSYQITVHNPVIQRVYIGFLSYENRRNTFQKVLEKFYNGDIFSLLFPFTWGGYESRDTEILEEIGLVYKSFRIDSPESNRIDYLLQEYRWRPINNLEAMFGLPKFARRQKRFIAELVAQIGSKYINF